MEKLFVLESGIKRKAEEYKCKKCGKNFLRRICKKPAKYCSKKCRENRRKVKIKCDGCGQITLKQISTLKNSKHGFHFCNRKCKEKAQSFKGNCPEIRPSHYGTSLLEGAKKSFRKYAENLECIGCGEKKSYLLQIHHIDGNKLNNIKSNFEVVCSNCHIKRHLFKKENDWVYWPKALTSRNLLKIL